MKKEFEQLKNSFEKALSEVSDSDTLGDIRNKYLGRKGSLAALMKKIGSLSDKEKKEIGRLANEIKISLEASFEKKEKEMSKSKEVWIDKSEPGLWPETGHLHPVSTAIAEITDIFSRIGFTRVRAPEIDWDFYAFESLNIPIDHPARDEWETFFIDAPEGKKGRIVLTPHTSNSQVREMEKGVLPIRMININRTYRRQSDVSHVPMFQQFEGLMIDKDLTIAHLKGVLDYFAKTYFGPKRKIRLRPHHFRFTEPSFEVDISCDICDQTDSSLCRLCKSGWLELGGAGMVHPNVLKAGGVDSNKYTGFAFGWGIERTLMQREGIKIDDIRILYKSDLRFTKQF